MKIGDKVRFLSEIGGGVVAGFQGKNIVLVEDNDGFQIPVQINEVVVVGDEDYSTTNVVETKNSSKKIVVPDDDVDYDPSDRPITFKPIAEERRGGDVLSAYLAFVPVDSRELTNTRFESYIVNDSNYYLRYTFLTAEGSTWHFRSTGEVEPNMKLFIEMRFLGLKNMESHHTLYLQKKKQCASIKALIENRLNIPPMISTNTRQKAPFSFLVQFPSKMLNCFLLELQGVKIKFQMD